MSDVDHALQQGSIADLRATLLKRAVSATEMVEWYLRRIGTVSERGPALNAVRIVSPDARDIAARADAAAAAGRVRGPLHGIPVLVKDNFLSGDGMTATAGAAAFASFRPRRDASIVRRLRQAGAIILGKTNMTELADYVSDVMPSEFSGGGGVVRNPLGVAYGRGQGSSVGSAAAVAAGLAPVALGTETQNSIQAPAVHTSIVGFKPSAGVVSRAGVVPLVPSQDSPGVLARSVEDAALVFSVVAGADCADTSTLEALLAPAAPLDHVRGLRLGVPRRAMAARPEFEGVMALFQDVLAELSRAGAVIVDPCDLPSAEQLQDVRSSVFRTEFKAALDAFLEDHDAPGGIRSLAELIRWNDIHPDKIPYGQSLLIAANETGGLDEPQYRQDRARDIVLSRAAGIDAALSAGAAEALVLPMSAAAKCTGKAGAPVLALPAGASSSGAPFGITLVGRRGDDLRVLAIGKAIERVVGHRIVPQL